MLDGHAWNRASGNWSVIRHRGDDGASRISCRLAEELGNAVAVPCNVTDAAQVQTLVSTAIDAYGRIDVWVNNAGQGLQTTIDLVNPEDFRAVLELNLIASLVAMQAVIPVMRKQGAGIIINVSSGITFSALPGSGRLRRVESWSRETLDDRPRRARRGRHHCLADVPVNNHH